MGIRRAVLEKVFRVKNTNGMFSDAIFGYYASATACTLTSKRIGQIVIGNTGTTWKAWKAKAAGLTGTAAWEALPIT